MNKPVVPERKCPYCASELNAVTEIEEDGVSPGPGDFTICFYCSGLLSWDADMNLIKIAIDNVPEKYRKQVRDGQEFTKAYRLVRQAQAAKDGRN